eukprot:scaffold208825_cov32-Tisochrysis_lutea.AAC.4
MGQQYTLVARIHTQGRRARRGRTVRRPQAPLEDIWREKRGRRATHHTEQHVRTREARQGNGSHGWMRGG